MSAAGLVALAAVAGLAFAMVQWSAALVQASLPS